MTAARLLAWRHGRTAYNRAGRLQGQVDIPLDDVGRWQARTAAAAMLAQHEVAAIVSSDLSRARETASALARACGLPVVVDERLRERGFGVWEGLSGDEIGARWPDQLTVWRRGGDPEGVGAETREQVATRYAQGVGEHATALDGGTLVVVSHGAATSAGVGVLLGLPASWHGLSGMRNAHWAALMPERSGGGWRLHGYNLGPTDASSDWDAGPDPDPAAEQSQLRDPD